MKRAAIVLALLLVLGVGIWLLFRARDATPPATANETLATNVSVIAEPAATTGTSSLLGETILRGYADTNLPPENDLTLMARLLENSLLLLKNAANRPLSANEDWADLLRGKNAARERFLSDQSIALNEHGQLVDRWRTPLFFHAAGGGRYEIRSAGPDKTMWTADDLHRNHDGSFRRGAELNPPSLFDSPRPR